MDLNFILQLMDGVIALQLSRSPLLRLQRVQSLVLTMEDGF